MYELYLTASVADSDVVAACQILSGLCGMKPWESVTRQLFFQGSSPPTGISNQRLIEKPMRKETGLLWKDLHQNLSRQPYILQAKYDVVKERDFAPVAAPKQLDEMQGILRWSDMPDPPHGKPHITQCKIVELWEQKNLVSLLNDNKFRFKSEVLIETKRFYREDNEFSLKRTYYISDGPKYTSAEHDPTRKPRLNLPAWDDLVSMDPEQRWVFQVTVHVLQDNKPDEIRKAQEQLSAIQKELDGVFEFRQLDRKIFDTRISQRPQGVQILGTKITVPK